MTDAERRAYAQSDAAIHGAACQTMSKGSRGGCSLLFKTKGYGIRTVIKKRFVMSSDVVKGHLKNFWPNRKQDFFTWELGPIKKVLPHFIVCRVAPHSLQDPWIYVTVGANEVNFLGPYGVEFVLLGPDDNARHIETLAIVAHYHATAKNKLDAGQIVNCGRPWLATSACDHFLVSLPYSFGPNFEWCRSSSEKDIRFLWLLPITGTEALFAHSFGVESLEQRFDLANIDAIDPERKAVA